MALEWSSSIPRTSGEGSYQLEFSPRAYVQFTCEGNHTVESGDLQRLDQFGGIESVRFNPSGFFRVEKSNRWWFVTPDGAAFLSFGLNHPGPEFLLQDYNIDHWKSEFGFQESSELAFRNGFRKKVMDDLAKFGMNSIGTHARKEIFGKMAVPYVQGLFFVETPYWMEPSSGKFPDVFSSGFVNRCEDKVQSVVFPRKDDPFLLGYTFTDCPILTDLDAEGHGQVPPGGPSPNLPTWPRVLRNLGANSPGKKVFVSIVRERYSTIQSFDQVYGTKFSSFDDLLEVENWSSVKKQNEVNDGDDNSAFLLQILERYYTVAVDAIREVDEYHLIFGDIINANTGAPDDVVSLITSYSDLLAFQFYGYYDEQRSILDHWSKLTGKALFHADSCFSVPYEEMPRPIGPRCPDQEMRAQRFFEYATQAFSRPDFIGWNWCGWVDRWAEWKKEYQHSGLQDPFGNYHHPMPETMARFGEQLYEYGLGRRPQGEGPHDNWNG